MGRDIRSTRPRLPSVEAVIAARTVAVAAVAVAVAVLSAAAGAGGAVLPALPPNPLTASLGPALDRAVADLAAHCSAAAIAQAPGLAAACEGAAEQAGTAAYVYQGSPLVRRARERITPLVGELIGRAQAAGQLPEEVAPGDFVLAELMVVGVIDQARSFSPDLWRRALALALAGLREGQGLPGAAPDDAAIDRIHGADDERRPALARRAHPDRAFRQSLSVPPQGA